MGRRRRIQSGGEARGEPAARAADAGGATWAVCAAGGGRLWGCRCAVAVRGANGGAGAAGGAGVRAADGHPRARGAGRNNSGKGG